MTSRPSCFPARPAETTFPWDILLVHSQDHLMTAMLCQDLAEEIINLYELKQDK